MKKIGDSKMLFENRRTEKALAFFKPHIPRYSKALARQPALLIALHTAVVKKEVAMQELKALGAVYVKLKPEQQAQHHEALRIVSGIHSQKGIRPAIDFLKQSMASASTTRSVTPKRTASLIISLNPPQIDNPSVKMEKIARESGQTSGSELADALKRHAVHLEEARRKLVIYTKAIETTQAVSQAIGVSEVEVKNKLHSLYDKAHEKLGENGAEHVMEIFSNMCTQRQGTTTITAKQGLNKKWFDETVKLFTEAVDKSSYGSSWPYQVWKHSLKLHVNNTVASTSSIQETVKKAVEET